MTRFAHINAGEVRKCGIRWHCEALKYNATQCQQMPVNANYEKSSIPMPVNARVYRGRA